MGEEISETQMKPGLKAEGSWSNVFSYHTMDIEVAKSEGIYFYDVNGNKYIDASGGPMAFTLPHGDKRMKEAISKQMENFTHVHPTHCSKLAEVTPKNLNTS